VLRSHDPESMAYDEAMRDECEVGTKHEVGDREEGYRVGGEAECEEGDEAEVEGEVEGVELEIETEENVPSKSSSAAGGSGRVGWKLKYSPKEVSGSLPSTRCVLAEVQRS
jgi:hypothetical protein